MVACGTLVSRFLGIADARANPQTGKSIAENTVAMEIYFLAVAGLDEAELAGRIKPRHRPGGRPLVMFHLTLGAAHLILKLSARVLEGIVDGECQIGMPLVGRRSLFNVHLAAVRQRKADMNLVKAAGAVMLTGSF